MVVPLIKVVSTAVPAEMAFFFLGIIAAAAAFYFISSTRRMALLVVLAAFVTRPSLDVGGLTLRVEMVVGALALVRLTHDVMSQRSQKLAIAVKWSIGLTVAWLTFASVSSLNIAPYPQRSISVLIWCLLNVITAVWIAKTPGAWFWILRYGTGVALICCFLAVVLWFGATLGVSNYGVQIDPEYGGYAAFVFSFEANILAGLLCLWALVAVVNPLGAVPQWIRLSLAVSAPVAILTTHTRAALVAYAIGLLACVFLQTSARRIAITSLSFGGLGAALLLLGGNDVGFSKFLAVFDIDDGTGGLRNRVATVAITEWWSSSERFIGLGWNSFGQRHIDETRPSLLLPGYIGNLPVQILYDSGLIGALLLTLAVSAAAAAVYRARRLSLLVVILVPYVLFSIATMVLWLLETWIFVGLAWGLCTAADLAQRKDPTTDPGNRNETLERSPRNAR